VLQLGSLQHYTAALICLRDCPLCLYPQQTMAHIVYHLAWYEGKPEVFLKQLCGARSLSQA
jgi:hypothetical protein